MRKFCVRFALVWRITTGRNVGCQEVSRCHTRGEAHVRLCQVLTKLPTLALKPRGDKTEGYQCPHKKDVCLLKFFVYYSNQKKKLCFIFRASFPFFHNPNRSVETNLYESISSVSTVRKWLICSQIYYIFCDKN